MPALFRTSRPSRRSVFHGMALLGAVLFIVSTQPSVAQPASSTGARMPTAAVDGIRWSDLTASQRNALRPLEAEWGRIDGPRRSKWLEMADRFPKMSPAEQARIQNRMTEWAKLTPRERGQARMNFREAQQVPAQERRAKWEEYKTLPPEQRKQLAAKAVPPARKSGNDSANSAVKSNVVPNPSYAPKPKPVAPTVAQAQPGATTNLITRRPVPPAHQPAGLPKIAVTPGFVDQSTLLPKRGPQGAATRSAAAAASSPSRQ